MGYPQDPLKPAQGQGSSRLEATNSPFSRPCLEALWVVEENRQVRACSETRSEHRPTPTQERSKKAHTGFEQPCKWACFHVFWAEVPTGYLPGERIQPAGELPQPRAQHGREPGIWSASRPSSSRRARCSQRRTAASLYGRARTGTETTGAVGCRSSAEAPPAQFPAPAPRRPCREGQPKAPLEKAVEPELRLTPRCQPQVPASPSGTVDLAGMRFEND